MEIYCMACGKVVGKGTGIAAGTKRFHKTCLKWYEKSVWIIKERSRVCGTSFSGSSKVVFVDGEPWCKKCHVEAEKTEEQLGPRIVMVPKGKGELVHLRVHWKEEEKLDVYPDISYRQLRKCLSDLLGIRTKDLELGYSDIDSDMCCLENTEDVQDAMDEAKRMFGRLHIYCNVNEKKKAKKPAKQPAPVVATGQASGTVAEEDDEEKERDKWAGVDGGARWVPDEEVTHCMAQGCNSKFTLLNRRHHCRKCGGLFCGKHVNGRMRVVLAGKAQKACKACFVESGGKLPLDEEEEEEKAPKVAAMMDTPAAPKRYQDERAKRNPQTGKRLSRTWGHGKRSRAPIPASFRRPPPLPPSRKPPPPVPGQRSEPVASRPVPLAAPRRNPSRPDPSRPIPASRPEPARPTPPSRPEPARPEPPSQPQPRPDPTPSRSEPEESAEVKPAPPPRKNLPPGRGRGMRGRGMRARGRGMRGRGRGMRGRGRGRGRGGTL